MGNIKSNRLSFNKETLRRLDDASLHVVIGGGVWATGTCAGSGCPECHTVHACPIARIWPQMQVMEAILPVLA